MTDLRRGGRLPPARLTSLREHTDVLSQEIQNHEKSQDEKEERQKYLIDKTRRELDGHERNPRISSPNTEEIEKMFVESGTVFISGSCGCGKSWHGLELLSRSRKRYLDVNKPGVVVRLNDLHDLALFVGMKEEVTLLLDDIFGKINLMNISVRTTINILNEVWSTGKRPKLIITIRSNILYEGRDELENCFCFDMANVFDLNNLETFESNDERKRILDGAVKLFEVHVVENEEDENVYTDKVYDPDVPVTICRKTLDAISTTQTQIGFMQCCQLFFRNRVFARKGIEYFTDPIFFLDEELNLLAMSDLEQERTQFLIMAYLMLQGGSASLTSVNDEDLNLLAKDFTIDNLDDYTLKESLENILGIYVTKDVDSYLTFQHDLILERVLHVYGEMFPDHLIRMCNTGVLCEFLRTDNYQDSNGESTFKISPIMWTEWINRALHEIKMGNLTLIISHPSMSDNLFVGIFIEKLMNSEFISHASDIFKCACNQDALYIVHHLIKLTQRRNSSPGYSLPISDIEIIDGLEEACKRDSSMAAKVILDNLKSLSRRKLIKCFYYACSNGSCKTVEQFLRLRQAISTEEISKGLLKSCSCRDRPLGKYGDNTVRFILRTRKDLSIDHILQGLIEACRTSRHNTVKLIMRARPDLSDQCVSKALVEASKCTRNYQGGNVLKCVECIIKERSLSSDILSLGFKEACGNLRSDIVDLYLRLCPTLTHKQITLGLCEAADKGRCLAIEIILKNTELLSKYEVTSALMCAGKSGQTDAFKIILNLRKDLNNNEITKGLVETCAAGKSKTAYMIIHQQTQLTEDEISQGLVAACGNGHIETINVILELRKDLSTSHLANGLIASCTNGHAHAVKALVKGKPEISLADFRKSILENNSVLNIWIADCIEIMLQQQEI